MKYEIVVRITMKEKTTKKYLRYLIKTLVSKRDVEKITVHEIEEV